MARPSSSDRARRLLSILARLEPGTNTPVTNLADELGISPTDLTADLEKLSLCGIAPFTPDTMIDVFVVDGMVEVYGPLPALDQPIRLSSAEAEAVIAALQASGIGSSGSMIERLSAITTPSFDPAETERMVRSGPVTHSPAVYEAVARAIDMRERTGITYMNARGVQTDRVVEPLSLFAERGVWYLFAFCETTQSGRTFRMDRLLAARGTGESFDPEGHDSTLVAPNSAVPTGDLPSTRLRFTRAAEYSARDWPGSTVVASDANGDRLCSDEELVVDVPYAGTDWIARRVVARLGSVEALSPPEVRDAVSRLAADYSA